MQVAPLVFSPPVVLSSTTMGRRAEMEWIDFFCAFQTIVLVANSDDQRLGEILRDPPPKPLYVFFNKIDRVLDAPFPHDCVLVTRCNTAGSEVVYRRRLPGMMRLMPAPFFKGVINLRAATRERLNRPEEFDDIPAGFMDLTSFLESFYPAQHTASSGFALVAWLKHVAPDLDIRLTGFSGERGLRWKVFHIHDWAFEQTALRLMEKAGLIRNDVDREQDPLPAFLQHFPQLDRAEARNEAVLVLSERLEKANKRIDKLISATAPLRLIYEGWRAVKWKSKKNRVLDKIKKEGLRG